MNRIEDEALKSAIKTSADYNIVVYDADCPENISARLIILLDDTLTKSINKEDRLSSLLVNSKDYKRMYEVVYGIKVEQTDFDITTYYNSIEAVVPYNKNRILLGIGEKGTVILGSYFENPHS